MAIGLIHWNEKGKGNPLWNFIARQGFALLALIPIWLYRGKQGYHSRTLQYGYYAFYPLHLLVLGLLKWVY